MVHAAVHVQLIDVPIAVQIFHPPAEIDLSWRRITRRQLAFPLYTSGTLKYGVNSSWKIINNSKVPLYDDFCSCHHIIYTPLGLISRCRWCRELGVGTGLGFGQLNLDPSSSNCLTRRAEGEPPVGPSCCDDRDLAGKCLGRSIRPARPANPRVEPKRLPLSI